MTNFKLFLRHAAQELGLDVIHSLKIVVTELFSTLRRWSRKESSATQDLMDAAWVLKELVNGSLDDMRVTFFKVVRSPEDFWMFVKTFKKEATVVCRRVGVNAHPGFQLQYADWYLLLDKAYAADCFDWEIAIKQLKDSYPPAVIDQVIAIKKIPGFSEKVTSKEALEGLAETIHIKIKKSEWIE